MGTFFVNKILYVFSATHLLSKKKNKKPTKQTQTRSHTHIQTKSFSITSRIFGKNLDQVEWISTRIILTGTSCDYNLYWSAQRTSFSSFSWDKKVKRMLKKHKWTYFVAVILVHRHFSSPIVSNNPCFPFLVTFSFV